MGNPAPRETWYCPFDMRSIVFRLAGPLKVRSLPASAAGLRHGEWRPCRNHATACGGKIPAKLRYEIGKPRESSECRGYALLIETDGGAQVLHEPPVQMICLDSVLRQDVLHCAGLLCPVGLNESSNIGLGNWGF